MSDLQAIRSTDLQMLAVSSEMDHAWIDIRPVRPPDLMDRVYGRNVSGSRIGAQTDPGRIGSHARDAVDGDGGLGRGVHDPVDCPFQARDVGKVGNAGGGRKIRKESRKFRTIFDETWGGGKIAADEGMRGVLKESLAHQPTHHRKR